MGTEFGENATFEQRYVYPEFACKEALINAIAHRDYTIQTGIDLFIYEDRLEIRSPGTLLSTISIRDIENLKGVHESRNTLIAKVLRENKLMRELGEGFKRIFEILSEYEMTPPKIVSINTYFAVIMANNSIYTQKEQEWLSLFDSFKLNRLQKRIVALGLRDDELSPNDIYKALNTKDRNVYDSIVTSLRVQNILREIRSNSAAMALSRSKKISKQNVGRFKVAPPDKDYIINKKVIENAVFVFNIPSGIDLATLKNYFAKYGPVIKVDMPEYPDGHHKSYAFVYFKDDETANKVLSTKEHSINELFFNVSVYIKKLQ